MKHQAHPQFACAAIEARLEAALAGNPQCAPSAFLRRRALANMAGASNLSWIFQGTQA